MICPVCGKISDNPFYCIYCCGSNNLIKNRPENYASSPAYRMGDSSDGDWPIQAEEIASKLRRNTENNISNKSEIVPLSNNLIVNSPDNIDDKNDKTSTEIINNIDSSYEESLKSTLSNTYEIVRKLGKGGMANVYLAREMDLGREVAIKIFSPEFMGDEQFIDRFRREARILANLDNNHIVKIYHISEKRNPWYFIMSYLPGGTLLERINSQGHLDASEILKIAGDVCSALFHAHSNGIIHRDIKPENILFDKNGDAVLTDFGIARTEAGLNLTRPGTIIGTPLYMSPEQAKGSETDCRSDIYSLGIVLYQMAAGVLPFSSKEAMSIMYMHVHETPVPPVSHNPELMVNLNDIIMKCIEKHPEDRYQNITELSLALKNAMDTKPHKSLLWFLT
jgi:serine/threonine protein kinase